MGLLFDLINDVKPTEIKELEDIDIIGSSPLPFTENSVASSRQSSGSGSMWQSTGVKHVDATAGAKRAFDYYKSKGVDSKVAAGVVGNLFRESGLNPNAVGDGGTSFGVAQWHNERFAGLKRFAEKQGKNWQDLPTQLDYVLAEQPNTIAKMKSATNERHAAEIFTDEFERPNPKYAAKDIRMGMASSLVKMAYGGPTMIKRADGLTSKRGLWDSIRANKGSGKKPTTKMLKQEKKIKNKAKGGLTEDQGQALGSGLNFIGDFTESFDTNKNYSDRTLSTVGGVLKGAGSGAAIGSSFGPIGTAVGAGVGAIVGGISGNAKAKKKKKFIRSTNRKFKCIFKRNEKSYKCAINKLSYKRNSTLSLW